MKRPRRENAPGVAFSSRFHDWSLSASSRFGKKANFGLKKVHKYLNKKRPPIASNDRRARSLCALELDSFT
jgi:hypothetical protein